MSTLLKNIIKKLEKIFNETFIKDEYDEDDLSNLVNFLLNFLEEPIVKDYYLNTNTIDDNSSELTTIFSIVDMMIDKVFPILFKKCIEENDIITNDFRFIMENGNISNSIDSYFFHFIYSLARMLLFDFSRNNYIKLFFPKYEVMINKIFDFTNKFKDAYMFYSNSAWNKYIEESGENINKITDESIKTKNETEIVKDEIKDLKSNYSNLTRDTVTILSLFIGMFSLIVTNLSKFNDNISLKSILVINLSIILAIVIIFTMVFIVFNRISFKKNTEGVLPGISIKFISLIVLIVLIILAITFISIFMKNESSNNNTDSTCQTSSNNNCSSSIEISL